MFIWHTSDDDVVDVQHSLKLASSLRTHNIQFELHIFPSGFHGLGLAHLHTDISKWAQMSVDWIIKTETLVIQILILLLQKTTSCSRQIMKL